MPEIFQHGEQNVSARSLTIIIYVLYALLPFFFLPVIVAIVLNYIKKEDMAGTPYASHFTWQIRTFWFALLWAILSVPFVLIGLGIVFLCVVFVWYVYRVVKGLLRAIEEKPMY